MYIRDQAIELEQIKYGNLVSNFKNPPPPLMYFEKSPPLTFKSIPTEAIYNRYYIIIADITDIDIYNRYRRYNRYLQPQCNDSKT